MKSYMDQLGLAGQATFFDDGQEALETLKQAI
jgi:hypothetical protein